MAVIPESLTRPGGGDHADAAASVRTGATAILEVLEQWGVERVFICPGSTEAAFLDAVVTSSQVELVITTHEAISVSMADGYARRTGRPAVAYVHANVGLGNAIAHLFAAHRGRVPLVILNGIKSSSIQGRGAFTSADYMEDFVRQYTKSAWHVAHPSRVAEDVNRALRVAQMQPTGPTWVGLPQDMLEEPNDYPVPDVRRYQIRGKTRADSDTLLRVSQALRSSVRPLIVAGDDVARSGGVQDLIRLAERVGAGVLLEERVAQERVSYPRSRRHYVGVYAPNLPVLQQADLIFFAGTRCFVEFRHPRGPHVPPEPVIVHCHSDAREIANIYPVDIGVAGDVGLNLAELLLLLPEEKAPRSPWWDITTAAATAGGHGKGVARSEHTTESAHMTVREVMERIAQEVSPGTLVVDDSTTSRTPLVEALGDKAVESLYMSSAASLGWSVGAALGVQLAAPRERVIAVIGDGGMQFALPGLWSAVRYQIPVVFVVINNTTYAAVAASLREYGGSNVRDMATLDLPGVDISGPDFARIASGFGMEAFRVTKPDELTERLRAALQSQRPTLLDAMTDPNDLGVGLPIVAAT